MANGHKLIKQNNFITTNIKKNTKNTQFVSIIFLNNNFFQLK